MLQGFFPHILYRDFHSVKTCLLSQECKCPLQLMYTLSASCASTDSDWFSHTETLLQTIHMGVFQDRSEYFQTYHLSHPALLQGKALKTRGDKYRPGKWRMADI